MGLWQPLKYTDYQKNTFAGLTLSSLRNTVTPEASVLSFFEGNGKTCIDITKSKTEPTDCKRSQENPYALLCAFPAKILSVRTCFLFVLVKTWKSSNFTEKQFWFL